MSERSGANAPGGRSRLQPRHVSGAARAAAGASLPLAHQARLQGLRDELNRLRRELAACLEREASALSAAQVDVLTGLPNRRVFDERMERHLNAHASRHAQLALLFLDLDDFKAVNDAYGHTVGDALLRLVGLRLRHSMREQDLACRLGGDEFVCVLLDLGDEHELQVIADKLRVAVQQPCQIGEVGLTVRPSIGAALFPRDGASTPALLEHADRAMYHAKRLRLSPTTAAPAALPTPLAPPAAAPV